MDAAGFDTLTRTLAVTATRRGAVAALLGLAAGAWSVGGGAGKRRCRRDSPPGQCCRKRHGAIACTCDDGGTVCGAACCLPGQSCESGRCVDTPEPPVCIVFGQPCKDVGRPCCAGLACGSGQGGQTDIACWVPAGGACATTAECVYGSSCGNGVCIANPQPTPTPRCEPTFAATGDPGADGLTLQQTVRDAPTGATIVLAPGEYRFDAAQDPGVGDSGLEVRSKSIAIERCTPDAVVTLVCGPATLAFPFCVSVNGTSGPAALSLKGVDVEVRRSTAFAVSSVEATLALEDTRLTVAGVYAAALSLNSSTQATLRGRVTLANRAAGTIHEAALTATESTVTCTEPLAIEGYPSDKRCRLVGSSVDPVCGCG